MFELSLHLNLRFYDVKVWLGLGTENIWFGFGKDYVLSLERWLENVLTVAKMTRFQTVVSHLAAATPSPSPHLLIIHM